VFRTLLIGCVNSGNLRGKGGYRSAEVALYKWQRRTAFQPVTEIFTSLRAKGPLSDGLSAVRVSSAFRLVLLAAGNSFISY
jgi:hypothetical protein